MASLALRWVRCVRPLEIQDFLGKSARNQWYAATYDGDLAVLRFSHPGFATGCCFAKSRASGAPGGLTLSHHCIGYCAPVNATERRERYGGAPSDLPGGAGDLWYASSQGYVARVRRKAKT